jgi:hypothetical protein
MKAAVIILGMCVLLTVGVTALVAGLGYVPGLTNLTGIGKPKDLGVTYTEADYLEAQTKIKQANQGTVPQTLTDAELSALFNACASTGCPFKDIQVKTNADGTFELSGLVDKQQVIKYADQAGSNDDITSAKQVLNYLPVQTPFYAQANIAGRDDVLSFVLQSAQLATISVPDSLLIQINAEVTAGINKYLQTLPGTQIENFEATADGLLIEGDLRLLKL